jgi:4-hydroxysphinganine ceramide fatty acyl 2-hydroxylase
MERAYITMRGETVRMFDNPVLEFCSHVHPITPLVIYLPAIAFLLYRSVTHQLAIMLIGASFCGGVLLWTLLEYVIHRWCFHYEPRSGWGRKLHFIVHGVHHGYPNDSSRLVMPPSVSLPLAFLFYTLLTLLFGRAGWPVCAGLVFGYVCYDAIHYATHHFSMTSRIGAALKACHLRHHFEDDHAGYGVSSPLWDYVFRTTRADSLGAPDAGD